ncbi:hypothetical protein CPB85DRAFT_1434763 [Mucidula mucida]|nr:hypothetical protein CPB85DRAFT_1434763 [Mucidula mucida]
MSVFVTAHGPTGDDAQFLRSVESADSAVSSWSSDCQTSLFSHVPTTTSAPSPDMKIFGSPQSAESQRSRFPSPDGASFYPKYYNPPSLVRPHIYKCTFAPAQCRVPTGSILQPFLDAPGTIWVNKIPVVDALCPVISRRQDQLALLRRPSGFGKTTFLSTSEFIHDVLNERAVAHAFGPRPSSFSYFRGDRLVLPVDLQGVFYDTSENMCSSANAYLNSIYRSFLRQYAEQLDLFDEDEILSYVHPTSKDTFDEILTLLTYSGHKLILLIDNFNWPLLKSTPENYIAISHVVLDCISQPFRTDDDRVRGAFGFTLPEVQALAAEALGEVEGIKFVDELKQCPAAYRRGDYIEYSMDDVLERLKPRIGQSQFQYGWKVRGNIRFCAVSRKEIFRSQLSMPGQAA